LKNGKIAISPQNCFTDFDEIWHSYASGTFATCRPLKLMEFERDSEWQWK